MLISKSVRTSKNTQCCFRDLSNDKIRLIWEITSRCNLSCKHCFISTNRCGDLKTEEIFRIVDNLDGINLGKIMLTGGEVFLRNDLLSILEYVKNKFKDVIIDITTNGTLLDKNNVTKLKELGVEELSISIDGTSQVHDYQRNKIGSFNKMIMGVDLLIFHDITVDGIMVLNKTNFNCLEETIDIAFKSGFSSLNISNLLFLKNSTYDYNLLKLNDTEIEKATEIIDEKKSEFGQLMPIKMVGFNKITIKCYVRNIVSINSQGDVMHCFLSSSKNVQKFNALNQKLKSYFDLEKNGMYCT
ncbi:MAG: radical SAM protein [Defluviitaleaceae bacterium]|nr:radical SAM protein [Defluviitaleaceae bacterium]